MFEQQIDSVRRANKRVNIWEGPVRSGKTWSSIYKWIHYIKYGPLGPLAMIGKTERTLKRNIVTPMKQILGLSIQHNVGSGEIRVGNRLIYTFGANDARAEDKIRGGTWAGAYGDELTLWPENVFKCCLSRISVDDAQFFGTTNSDGPYHWLKTDYLDRISELNLADFHFELDWNVRPQGFLSPEFVNDLKREYTGLWYQRFILGLWVLAEGTIYDMWDESIHVRDVIDPHKFDNYAVAIDYGTGNPTTFGLYGWNNEQVIRGRKPKIPISYLITEYYYDSIAKGRQKTDAEYGKDFDKFMYKFFTGGSPELIYKEGKLKRIYLDPSAASFRAELRRRGWIVSDARNDVLDGIRLKSTCLSNNRFFVSPTCKHTIAEHASYVWDVNAQKRGEDKPLKQHDHCMDRDRYFLYSQFGAKKKQAGVWGT